MINETISFLLCKIYVLFIDARTLQVTHLNLLDLDELDRSLRHGVIVLQRLLDTSLCLSSLQTRLYHEVED